MNPYDFVPIDLEAPPKRHKPILHEKFVPDTVSGTLTAKITAKTPIFVKQGSTDQFTKNNKMEPIIPGTSLKGLFRSLVETVANGCFLKFDGQYEDRQRGTVYYAGKLRKSFKICENPDSLCIACRIFGMQSGNDRFTGKVSFQDAVCNNPIPHPPVHTIILMGPKPHHTAFYLDENERFIAGRKFYFHHPTKVKEIKSVQNPNHHNPRISPVGTGSQFHFSVDFTSLEETEWNALLYTIVLEPGMRHKIGYAKPAGLGSVKIEIKSIRLYDYSKRYTSPNRGITELQGENLKKYIGKHIQSYVKNTSKTMVELRRIWRWDENDQTSYRYPPTKWFNDNPKAPISSTP